MSSQKPTESATILTPRLQPFARIRRLSRWWYSVHLEVPTTTGLKYATDPYTVPTRRWAEAKARRLLESYHKRAQYKYSYVYPGPSREAYEQMFKDYELKRTTQP